MSGPLFFVFFVLFVSYSNGQDPQTCISTSIEIYVTKDDPNLHLFNYSATLTIKDIETNPLTRFFVTDEVFTSSNSNIYRLNGDGLLAEIGPNKATRCSSVGGYCSWFVGNDTVFTSLPLDLNDYKSNVRFTENLIDEGGISLLTGNFFSDSFTCTKITMQTSSYPGYTFVVNQCCKEFMPVPAPAATSSKCLGFNATATFYNNNKVFAAVNASLAMAGDGITITAISEGPNLGYYSITQNRQFGFCNAQFGSPSTCMTLVPGNDFKVIFPLSIWQPSGQTWSYDTNLGRIISRNGIYEKEEGRRFTPMSPCSSQYEVFSNTSMWAISQFCCTSFT